MEPLSAHGPGRVELLGNHTDYNGGYVMSAAIDRGVTVSGRRLADDTIILHSGVMSAPVEVSLKDLAPIEKDAWANYPLGVAKMLHDAGYEISGFDASVSSDLPLGAGLSSSAALEVATGMLLSKLFGFALEPMELAKLCRKAENEFVGVNCGLLDQVSSVFGKKDHAIFLDCRNETVRNIPFPKDVALLITHSGVKHSLVGGEYNERRQQCFEAAKHLGVKELRDATRAQLEAARDQMPDVVFRRGMHVVGENERVLEGVQALESGDVEKFGTLMFASHESSRVNFENSTPELDALVDIVREVPGVLGSRLTGGGFGGATVTLLREDAARDVSERTIAAYRAKTGHECHTYVCELADGAR